MARAVSFRGFSTFASVVVLLLSLLALSSDRRSDAANMSSVTLYLNATAATDGSGSQTSPFNDPQSAFSAIQSAYTASKNIVTLYITGGASFPTVGSGLSIVDGAGVSFSLSIVGLSPRPLLQCVDHTVTLMQLHFTVQGKSAAFSHFDIDGCGAALDMLGLQQVDIDDVKVSNSTGSGSTYVVHLQDVGASLISNSNFSQNPQYLSSVVGIASATIAAARQCAGCNEERAVNPDPSNNTIVNSVFDGNNASLTNGAVLLLDTNADIRTCTFTNNNVEGAANTAIVKQENTAGEYAWTIQYDNCTFTSNGGDFILWAAGTSGSLAVTTKLFNTTIIQNKNNVAAIRAEYDNQIKFTDTESIVWQNNQNTIVCIGTATVDDANNNDLCNVTCTGGKKIDRCGVCGGNDSCVGCDGVPFSDATCTQPITTATNTTSATSEVTWYGNSPTAQMFSDNTHTYHANVSLGVLEEVDTGGNVVKAVDLNTIVYYVLQAGVQSDGSDFLMDYVHYSTDGTNTTIELQERFYYQATNVTSGSVTFPLPAETLKFTFKFLGWLFQQPSNILRFTMTTKLSEPVQSTSTTSIDVSGFTITELIATTAHTKVSLRFEEFAVLDGVTKAITVNQLSVTGSSVVYRVVLGGGFLNCIYDPDVGVLVNPNSGGSGGDGGTDDALIIGLTVGLGSFAIIVVVLVIVAVMVVVWWKVLRTRFHSSTDSDSMVNFDYEDEGQPKNDNGNDGDDDDDL